MSRRAQIIPPRVELMRKAINATKGIDLKLTPETVHQMEQVVHRSRDKFVNDIAARLAVMRGSLERLDAPGQRPVLDELYQHSLAIKGAGGTIGFDLLTLIGKSLNDFVAGQTRLDKRQVAVVSLHIDALYTVLANNVSGPGGAVEAAVIEAFDEVNERFKMARPSDSRGT
ncbi:MAG: hypothetical protein HQ481_15845 [Alphaproteobacteria bacterium]|nr:hypothetical protein [Alphaproteobacteria bacterium]